MDTTGLSVAAFNRYQHFRDGCGGGDCCDHLADHIFFANCGRGDAHGAFALRCPDGKFCGPPLCNSPPLLMAPLIIWDTCLSALLLAGVFWAAPFLSRQRLGYAALGAVCGIAALVNPALIVPLFLVCAFPAWQARKIPWAGILAFLIVFSPWPLAECNRDALVHSPPRQLRL